MSTGAQKVDIFLKKFLPQQQITENFFDYLEDLTREVFGIINPDNGVFTPAPDSNTIISSSNPNTFTITTPLIGTDGQGGHVIVPDPLEFTNVIFENANGVDYFVGARFQRAQRETEVNVRTGEIEYTFLEEALGELADPDVVVDDGDETLTITVDSVCEAGVSHAGRTCRVWLKRAENESQTFEDLTVIFTAGVNKIETTTALGQTTGSISTTAADYQVFLRGPTVRRNTDLRLDDNVLFLGIVEGAGSGNTPSTFDQTDVLDLSVKVSTLAALFAVEHDSSTGFHTDITPETIVTQDTITGVQLNTKVNASDEDVPDVPVSHSLFQSSGGTGIQGVKWRVLDSSGTAIAFIDAHGNAYFQSLAAVNSTFTSTLVVSGNTTLGDDINSDLVQINSKMQSDSDLFFLIDADNDGSGHFVRFFNNTFGISDLIFEINEDGIVELFNNMETANSTLAIDLDSDNDDTGETFSITKDGGGTLLWFINEFGDSNATRDAVTEAATAYAKISDASVITGVDASLNEVFDQTKTRNLLRLTGNNVADTKINIGVGRLTITSGEDFGLALNNTIVNYSGGTVDFATGTVTGGGSNFTPFSATASFFFKYGIVLDSSNLIIVTLPTGEAATEGTAPEPSLAGGIPIGVITVQDNGSGGSGTILNISEPNLLRLPLSPFVDGEVNTASNLGPSADGDVFKQKIGVDFQFRRLKAGKNISMVENANDIEISSTAASAGASLFEPLDREERGEFVFARLDSFLDSFNFDKGAALTDVSIVASTLRLDVGILSGGEYLAEKTVTKTMNKANGKFQALIQGIAPQDGQSPLNGNPTQAVIFDKDVTGFFEVGKEVFLVKKLDQFGGDSGGTRTDHVFLTNNTDGKVARLIVNVGSPPSFDSGNDETTVTFDNPNTEDLAFGIGVNDLNSTLRFLPWNIQLEVSADAGVNFTEMTITNAQGVDVISLLGESFAEELEAPDRTPTQIAESSRDVHAVSSENGRFLVYQILRATGTSNTWEWFFSADGSRIVSLGTRTLNDIGGLFSHDNLSFHHKGQIAVSDNGRMISSYLRKNDSGNRGIYGVFADLTATSPVIDDMEDSGSNDSGPTTGRLRSESAVDAYSGSIGYDKSDMSFICIPTAGGPVLNSHFYIWTGSQPTSTPTLLLNDTGGGSFNFSLPVVGRVVGSGTTHRALVTYQRADTGQVQTKLWDQSGITNNGGDQTIAYGGSDVVVDCSQILTDGSNPNGVMYVLQGDNSLNDLVFSKVINAETGAISQTKTILLDASSGVLVSRRNGLSLNASNENVHKTLDSRMKVLPSDSKHALAMMDVLHPDNVIRTQFIEILNTSDIKGIQEVQYVDSGTQVINAAASNQQIAQCHTVSGTRIRTIAIRVHQVGIIPVGGTLSCRITNTSGANPNRIPTTDIATAVATVDAREITKDTAGQYIYFPFDSASLASLTQDIGIVITPSYATDASNHILWHRGGDETANGNRSQFNGATWSAIDANDLVFEIHGEWVRDLGDSEHNTNSPSNENRENVESGIEFVNSTSLQAIWRKTKSGTAAVKKYDLSGWPSSRIITPQASNIANISDLKIAGFDVGNNPTVDDSIVFTTSLGVATLDNIDVNNGNLNGSDQFQDASGHSAEQNTDTDLTFSDDTDFLLNRKGNFNGSTTVLNYRGIAEGAGLNIAHRLTGDLNYIIEAEIKSTGSTGGNQDIIQYDSRWVLALNPSGFLKILHASGDLQFEADDLDLRTSTYFRVRLIIDRTQTGVAKSRLFRATSKTGAFTEVASYNITAGDRAAPGTILAPTTRLNIGGANGSSVFLGGIGYTKVYVFPEDVSPSPAYDGFKDQRALVAVENTGDRIIAREVIGDNDDADLDIPFYNPITIDAEARAGVVVDSFEQVSILRLVIGSKYNYFFYSFF